ncbi:hypothetical protein Acsp03_03090 [Actinomadura sp. NBRC 104412]|uniref:hypothetical protein n=1 Tax=Actinomadura sp. NBRC 104412 TaxID=3032203 RepID=UPI0024A0BCE4|nr:hypothetical protein [Actinomadura sp. NBRC 104412]GLZ02842.1 hypothetical protein Acsp03_03090 [Actinomadura sp. NBRC 104412]
MRPPSLRHPLMIGASALVVAAGLAAAPLRPAEAGAAPGPAASAELSTTTRLADRRSVVIGDRFYAMSTADGLYPAAGWHITGEMGGFWTPPLKLLDGIWFGLDGTWLGDAKGKAEAERHTFGFGYTRTRYAAANGVRVERTDVVPDGLRAGLIGLKLTSDRTRTVRLDVDAHSELMSAYPWGWTTPDQSTYNLPDTGSYQNGALLFREQGTPPVANAPRHDFAAYVAADRKPVSHALGSAHRGPQDPPVVCPSTGTAPDRCDDSAFGKGTGGRLSYDVRVPAGRGTTVWVAVAGSDRGTSEAGAALGTALRDPAGLAARKIASRKALAANTVVDLPGDRRLQQSVEWSKQNLADSVQEARDLRIRVTREGRRFPAPAGTVNRARWYGAGWPDYPWLFGTDGEYTAFAAVPAGQFDAIKAHLRALRDTSEVANARSGKVVHEVISDGSVYFGANDDAGNTDETAKFPSAVALVWRWTGDRRFLDEMYGFTVRNMRFIVERWDEDGDGWPEGLGNVERSGMGVEKLDNAVYTIRGLRDLADMARAKGDAATVTWADARAAAMERDFDRTWWAGGTTDGFAESIDDPADPANDNRPIFQRHWTGVTPMDAVLVRPGQVTRPLASDERAAVALAKREEPCYTGENGFFHTGTGPTSAEGGNRGPSCDDAVSAVQSERSIYSLGNGVMATAEGNHGRLAQQKRYTAANARSQLDPALAELPGAMPEILPSPDFDPPNIDRKLTDRSMVLQAWGAYGTLWPVVHHQLGLSPDMGRGRLEIVPQLPPGQSRIAGRDIRVGSGSVAVTAEASARTLRTSVNLRVDGASLVIGHVLPRGAQVASVTLNGRSVAHSLRRSARGTEVVVQAGTRRGQATLTITLR